MVLTLDTHIEHITWCNVEVGQSLDLFFTKEISFFKIYQTFWSEFCITSKNGENQPVKKVVKITVENLGRCPFTKLDLHKNLQALQHDVKFEVYKSKA